MLRQAILYRIAQTCHVANDAARLALISFDAEAQSKPVGRTAD